MARKQKRKKSTIPTVNQPTVFRYYCEDIPTGDKVVLSDRLNEIGSLGWQLVFVGPSMLWFIGDESSVIPSEEVPPQEP